MEREPPAKTTGPSTERARPPSLPGRVRTRLASLHAMIGDTVLVELGCELDGVAVRVFAKHEVQNLTGSVKDRMALRILEEAWVAGAVHEGTEILEATSGNTGIAFAALGRALGHPVRIVMPDWMSRERAQLLGSLGARLVPVSAAEGGFVRSVALAEELARAEGADAFLPRQFANEANARAHARGTGPELLAQMRRAGCEPAAFVAGVGTGGTVMGVGAFLRGQIPGLRAHPLEPSNSPTLRLGKKSGSHRIQGISDEFVPNLLDLGTLDEIVDVRDGDAIRAAQRLARELGLGVGISSGANLLGALQVARDLGPGACVATLFPDSNKKYLSTALLEEEPPVADDLTDRLRFLEVRVHPRLGPTLCDLCGWRG